MAVCALLPARSWPSRAESPPSAQPTRTRLRQLCACPYQARRQRANSTIGTSEHSPCQYVTTEIPHKLLLLAKLWEKRIRNSRPADRGLHSYSCPWLLSTLKEIVNLCKHVEYANRYAVKRILQSMHGCLEGYSSYAVDPNTLYFYPLADDGTTIVRRSNINNVEQLVDEPFYNNCGNNVVHISQKGKRKVSGQVKQISNKRSKLNDSAGNKLNFDDVEFLILEVEKRPP
ncbi:uncharacterized protein [Temnothorax longispinosus]|uniref:uncharacterized protein n=1 Tax=Temnothorax longispinosus TaxID=300112 RepID=UPI003A990DD9